MPFHGFSLYGKFLLLSLFLFKLNAFEGSVLQITCIYFSVIASPLGYICADAPQLYFLFRQIHTK